MKAKVYLSHNCEEHRKYLGLTPDEACCNHQEMVGDYEVELLDTEVPRKQWNLVIKIKEKRIYLKSKHLLFHFL